MKKTWLIAAAAASSLVLMFWLGGEEPAPRQVSVRQAAPAPAPRPASEAPVFVPAWQRAPGFTQGTRGEAAPVHRFRPLTDKERQRMGRSMSAGAPRYATPPTEPPQPTRFYAQEPGTALQQYQFRPLERGHERYTGDFPQLLPQPVIPGPTWPAAQGNREQLYSYRQPDFSQPHRADRALR